MAKAFTRERASERGYSRVEMAIIKREAQQYRKEWVALFDSYLDTMAMDTETPPEALVRRAEALTDARMNLLIQKFIGLE